MQLTEVMVNRDKIEPALDKARQGIATYLESALSEGRIDQQLYAEAERQTYTNLEHWLTDEDIGRLCPNLKPGILGVIKNERWEWIVNAFRQSVRFGTGGIRGMMAFDRESIVRLKDSGIDSPILKGPQPGLRLVKSGASRADRLLRMVRGRGGGARAHAGGPQPGRGIERNIEFFQYVGRGIGGARFLPHRRHAAQNGAQHAQHVPAHPAHATGRAKPVRHRQITDRAPAR